MPESRQPNTPSENESPNRITSDELNEILNNKEIYTILINDDVAITIDEKRLTRFLEKNESKLHSLDDVKAELKEALQRDIDLLKSLQNKALPIFNNPFEILELKLENPITYITKAIDHLNELVKSKSGPGTTLLKKIRVAAMGVPTKVLLVTTHILNTGNSENADILANNKVMKLFSSLIENIWNTEVSRPSYKEGKRDPFEDDALLFPNRGDSDLRLKGSFYRSYKLEQSLPPDNSYVELAAKMAWSTLRQQILGRKEMQDEHPIVPIPIREKEGYWVVMQTSAKKGAHFRKVHIPWEIIGDREAKYESFLEHVVRELVNDANAEPMYGFKSPEECNEVAAADIFYDSPKHKELRSDKSNFADADLRIAFSDLGDSSLDDSNPYYFSEASTGGMRTPTVIHSNVNEDSAQKLKVQDVTTIYAHPFLDGQAADIEIEKFLQSFVSIKPESDPDLEKFARGLDDHNVKNFKTQETVDENPGYKFTLDSSSAGSKTGIINELYSDFTSQGDVAKKFKEKFNETINPYIIFNWALMISLGIDHVHFLEKDGAGLSPVPQELPYALRNLLKNKQSDKDVNALIASVSRFNKARSETKRSGIDEFGRVSIGASSLECLMVAAGQFREFLTGISNIFNPETSEIATNSFLVSYMTLGPRQLKNSSDARFTKGWFGTSTNTIYAQKGAIGITNSETNTSGLGWRGDLRKGEIDLIQKKYDTDPKNPKNAKELEKLFEEALDQNLQDIFKLVRNLVD